MSTTGDHGTVKRPDSDGQRSSLHMKNNKPLPSPASVAPAIPVPPVSTIPVDSSDLTKPALPAVVPDLVGSIIDKRFKIVSRLGKGGMSEVFKAEHLLLQKPLAIKMLHPQEANKINSIERFHQEAKAISTLDHPNIVKVYAFGLSENNQLYLAMDLLNGPSLAEILDKEGALHWSRAISLAIQIGDGLEQAHQRGIIHRDLKPSNIIVQSDQHGKENAKIVDFGIARLTSESGKEVKQLTAQGNTCGSPPYMSPEQCLGESIDARSDIYSFGCMLYELLSGAQPFAGRNSLETMQMHVEQRAKPLLSICPQSQIPLTLEAAVRKCMEKEPPFRYQSMSELRSDLCEIQADSLEVSDHDQAIMPAKLKNEAKVNSGNSGNSGCMRFRPRQVLALATGLTLIACALFCFNYHPVSQLSVIGRQIDKIQARDPKRIDKILVLLNQVASALKKSPSSISLHDKNEVFSRVQRLEGNIEAMPASLLKYNYETALVFMYAQLGKQNEAKSLAKSTLTEIEGYVAKETAKPHPNNGDIETALLQAINLCSFDPSNRDRAVGKYNILISIYLAQGRYGDVERMAAAALTVVKSEVPPNPIGEIGVRQSLASAYSFEGNFPAAELELQKSWQICKKYWPASDQFTKNVASVLANCYISEGKTKEAAEILSQTKQAIPARITQ